MGKTFRILDLQKQYIIDAGFENVVEQRYKMPVGPWSSDPKLKEIGRWHLLECFQGIEGWSMALLTRVMGVCGYEILQSSFLLTVLPCSGPSKKSRSSSPKLEKV